MIEVLCRIIGHSINTTAPLTDKEAYKCPRCGENIMSIPRKLVEGEASK